MLDEESRLKLGRQAKIGLCAAIIGMVLIIVSLFTGNQASQVRKQYYSGCSNGAATVPCAAITVDDTEKPPTRDELDRQEGYAVSGLVLGGVIVISGYIAAMSAGFMLRASHAALLEQLYREREMSGGKSNPDDLY